MKETEMYAQYSENKESDYQKVLDIALEKLQDQKNSFMIIGWCLKEISDRHLYRAGGFRSLSQFSREALHLSSSRTSSLKNLYIKFSSGGSTPALDQRYAGFTISKLEELLPVKTEDLIFFNGKMTIREIRDVKKVLYRNPHPDRDSETGTGTAHQPSRPLIWIDCIKHPAPPEAKPAPDSYGTYVSNGYILQELDPDNPGAAETFIGRKYAEFYQKHGYIPKYFNAKNCVEITSCTRTLATSCGSGTGIGSIVFFDAVKETAMAINNTSMGIDQTYRIVRKILRISEPSERQKVMDMLNRYRPAAHKAA